MKAELLTENLFSMKDFIGQVEECDIYHYLTAPTYAVKGTIKDLHKLNDYESIVVNDVSIFQLIKSDATHVEFQNRDFPFCIEELDGVAIYHISGTEIDNDSYSTEFADVQITVYNKNRNIDSYINIRSSEARLENNELHLNLEFDLKNDFTYGKTGLSVEYPFDFDGFSMHKYPSQMYISTNVTFDIDNTREYDQYDFEFIIVITETDKLTPILYGFITKKLTDETEEKYIRVMDYLHV